MSALSRLGWVTIRLSATGPAPLSLAWQRYEYLDLWPSWSPQLRRVEAAGRQLHPGLAGRVVGPVGVGAQFVVTAVDVATHTWSWTVRRWPITVELEHGLEAAADPASAGRPGSQTWLVLRGPAPVVLSYAPLAWYALHRLVTLPPPCGPS